MATTIIYWLVGIVVLGSIGFAILLELLGWISRNFWRKR